MSLEVLELKTIPFPAGSLFFIFEDEDVSSQLAAPAALPAACCHAIPTIMASNPPEL